MRVLFIVVSKVFGLYQAYSGLAYILTMLPFMRMLVKGSPDDNSAASMHTTFYGESLTLNVISISAMIVIMFSVAWIMIFRAEWLADKLQIPATDTSATFPVERLLHVGTKLIGLFMLVQGIPSFINAMIELRQMMLFGSHNMASLIPPLLRIIIGVVLVTKTDAIMKVMTRSKE